MLVAAGDAHQTGLLVAATAALSCSLTAVIIQYLLPKIRQYKQQRQQQRQHAISSTLHASAPALDSMHEPLFSPISHSKRPDPYDERPRSG
jgi:Na+-translocating ferredoxin:NAD+ oxidoreductase RnfG subunit